MGEGKRAPGGPEGPQGARELPGSEGWTKFREERLAGETVRGRRAPGGREAAGPAKGRERRKPSGGPGPSGIWAGAGQGA